MRNKVIFIVIVILCISSLIVYGYNKDKVKIEEERPVTLNDIIEITVEDIRKVARDGDTNIGSGGGNGDLGGAVSDDTKVTGTVRDEGVRVTLVEAKTGKVLTRPIDLANNPMPVTMWFGAVSKMSYLGIGNNKINLNFNSSSYNPKKPVIPLPKIINGDLATIKKYFGDKGFAEYFAQLTGYNYDNLVSGNYKLILEPVGYPKISGKYVACTATELAMFDQKLNGGIRKKLVDWSHRDLPLAMFLEENEFGISAYTGNKEARQNNETIIKQLGIGIIRFKEQPEEPEPPIIDKIDYVYRTDTEVITSVKVSGGEANPDKPKSYAVFYINGQAYESNQLTYPNGEFAYAYVKWRTPKKPQKMQIPVTIYTPNEESIPNDNGGFD